METVAFALRTSPNFKEAAKALTKISSGVYKKHKNDKGEDVYSALHIHSINETFNTLIKEGVSVVLDTLDRELARLAEAKKIGEGIAKFIMDNPAAPAAMPANFPEGSDERFLLTALEDEYDAWRSGDESGSYDSVVGGRFLEGSGMEMLFEKLFQVSLSNPSVTRGDMVTVLSRIYEGISTRTEAKGALMRAIAA